MRYLQRPQLRDGLPIPGAFQLLGGKNVQKNQYVYGYSMSDDVIFSNGGGTR